MPVTLLSERPLARRLAVRPRASGGFERATQPNPNSAIETYRRRMSRADAPIGARSSDPRVLNVGGTVQQPTPVRDPEDIVSMGGADVLGIGLQQRGMEARAREAYEEAFTPRFQGIRRPAERPTNVPANVAKAILNPLPDIVDVVFAGDPSVPRRFRNVLPDPRWEGLKQALFEAGVDRVQTGARAGYAPLGFFDTQETLNAAQQQRARLLQAMMVNEGNSVQASRIGQQFRI